MIVNQLQQDAFNFLQSGATAFANPLSGMADTFGSSMTNLGGLDFGTFDQKVTEAVNANKITSTDADNIRQCLAPVGVLDIAPNLAGVASSISAQTTTVVNNLPNVISAANSYGSMAAAFGSSPTICDGIKDLIGTLAGGLSSLQTAITDAFSGIASAFSSLSNTIKDMFATARAALDTLIAGGVALVSTITSSLTSFINGISSEIKNQIASLSATITSALTDMKNAIDAELQKIGEVFDYLKNAALSLTLGFLNPCAKQVIASCAGAAGAAPLVALVT